MPGTRLIVIDGESLLSLLTSYSDGLIPINATLKSVAVSPWLVRWLGLEVVGEWDDAPAGASVLKPLHLRYEGRKFLKWSQQQPGSTPTWTDEFEAPRRT